MMNQAIKEQWIQALRGGAYAQGKGQLRKGDTLCCLGILCDIASKQGIGEWSGDIFDVGRDVQQLTLPQAVADWAGLSLRNPKVGQVYDGTFQYTLADYNDGVDQDDSIQNDGMRPHTFAEIADLIEQFL